MYLYKWQGCHMCHTGVPNSLFFMLKQTIMDTLKSYAFSEMKWWWIHSEPVFVDVMDFNKIYKVYMVAAYIPT